MILLSRGGSALLVDIIRRAVMVHHYRRWITKRKIKRLVQLSITSRDRIMGMARVAEVSQNLVPSSKMFEIKGMNRTRLDRWVKQGYVHPTVVKGSRMYSHHDYYVVQVMAAMIDAGVGVDASYYAATHQGWLNDNVKVTIGSRARQREWKAIRAL